MSKRKNPEAQALARKRWKGTTSKERREQMAEAVRQRWAKYTPEERSRMMKRIRKGKAP